MSFMVIIYSKQKTERLNYTLKLIFTTILKTGYILTTDKNKFLQSELPRINYSDENWDGSLFLKPHPLLFRNDIAPIEITTVEYEGKQVFFPVSGGSFLPFDVFACSFYIASRYEEYLFTGKTKHGRFPATESILYKYRLLDEPVVNQWARLLAEKISEYDPRFTVPGKEFNFLMTIDVDNAWAYKNKALWIQAGAIARSVLKADFSGIKRRQDVLSGKEADPYDTYRFIDEAFKGNEDHLKFFFLLGDRGTYDRNIPYRNANLQSLIRHLAEKFKIGIHFSYASNRNREMVKKEKQRLESILGKKVTGSRQHFLLLNFPYTYENLIEAGITADYTMGYPDAVGFRAGLCTPFQFFNLEKNIATGLTVYPLHAMDVSLRHYIKLSPEQAVEEMNNLMQKVKETGGSFICLWHNESVNGWGEWKGWQKVFLQTIRTGLKFENV